MPNFDIQDLHGIYPTAVRWGAEFGTLGYSKFDDATGERTIDEIQLNTPEATFVMDLLTRERGYGLIRIGLYDMRLSPVGCPPPPWPGDDDFKPAIGCWLWNPSLNEVRLETNASIFLRSVSGVWDRCRGFKEASEGLQPAIRFVGRCDYPVPAVGKVFQKPLIDVIGWVDRSKVPSFALREPTVKPAMAIDSQVRHALLQHLQQQPKQPVRARGKAKPAPKQVTLEDLLDDEIPDLVR